ncbi:uncharacterized protein LOC116208949 [Punica granatum]|uniref:Uncharacterized protein n=2 Tax=Punica granatum TaxID=22663 RepID=A0A218XT74_PUNGR|nr:uncharacterized protein LOC116208949 [Punica granatum]OWM88018.1 hypothetical protein CDL15_Pgr016591 [Punica granatum]PKI62658.1 hypothetical protein CRG98_016929 [Punica granatum]
MALLPEEMRNEAEVFHGHDVCQQKLALLLAEIGLPNVLVSSPEIEEFCYVKPLGLVWLRLRNRAECKVVDNIVISYDTHVTARVEPNRIHKLTGIRAKECFVWVNLSEIEIRTKGRKTPAPSGSGLITFRTSVGFSRSFPVSAFE